MTLEEFHNEAVSALEAIDEWDFLLAGGILCSIIDAIRVVIDPTMPTTTDEVLDQILERTTPPRKLCAA